MSKVQKFSFKILSRIVTKSSPTLVNLALQFLDENKTSKQQILVEQDHEAYVNMFPGFVLICISCRVLTGIRSVEVK